MKKIFYVSLMLFTLTTVLSCKKDKEGTLVLHFKPVYDGNPLQTFVALPFTGGEQIQFNHLSLFVSDIHLFENNSTFALDDIELVDLSFENLQDAEEGFMMAFDQIPAGSMDGIRFSIGVAPGLNQMQPSDFASSHPLSQSSYYWQAWSSFIFTKLEGQLDTLGNGTFDTSFAFHTGSNSLYRIYEGFVPLVIEEGNEEVLDIVIDYKILMNGIDIKVNPQNHNPSDTAQIQKIVDNMASALTLVQ